MKNRMHFLCFNTCKHSPSHRAFQGRKIDSSTVCPGRAISDAVPNFHSWSARGARSCSPRRARGKLSRRWINCFRGREGSRPPKPARPAAAGISFKMRSSRVSQQNLESFGEPENQEANSLSANISAALLDNLVRWELFSI